jgi:tyrosyl-tRNA synthetase
MYGKLMSINDDLMWRYWTFLTDLPQSQIDTMKATVASGELHPMQAKKNLAHAITTDFHSTAEADAAAEGWATQFQLKGVAEDLPTVEVSSSSEGLLVDDGAIRVPKLLVLAGLAPSTGEATRKLAENAVSINGRKFNERTISREAIGDAPTLRLGKKSTRIAWL